MSELGQSAPVASETIAFISQSRQATLVPEQGPSVEPLAGNMLPRLCQFAGAGACEMACQAPAAHNNDRKDCATANCHELFDALGIDPKDVYQGGAVGGTNIAFIDNTDPHTLPRGPEGLKYFAKTDAVFGYSDTIKGCRMADCGMLVVSGKDKDGWSFDGFIHATRHNLNGDDQCATAEGEKVGGVELMLRSVTEHYQPSQVTVRLASGITPENYIWDFTPSPEMLAKQPELTAEEQRESKFRGWFTNGWLRPHLADGTWDGRKYEVNMLAAIRHQVERAGYGDVYEEAMSFEGGNPLTGHASNAAGKHGLIPEARDFYVVAAADYWK